MTEQRSSAVNEALRHYPRRSMTGDMEVVDRQFDFVRAVLPYDYRYTCNAQQWGEAERICRALEGPMTSQGVVAPAQVQPHPDIIAVIDPFTRGAFTGWKDRRGFSKITLDEAEDHFSLCMADMMDAVREALALQSSNAQEQSDSGALRSTLEDIIAVYEWCSVDTVDRGYSTLDNEIHRAKHLLASLAVTSSPAQRQPIPDQGWIDQNYQIDRYGVALMMIREGCADPAALARRILAEFEASTLSSTVLGTEASTPDNSLTDPSTYRGERE